MKTYTLEEITDQLIGGKGSPERKAVPCIFTCFGNLKILPGQFPFDRGF